MHSLTKKITNQQILNQPRGVNHLISFGWVCLDLFKKVFQSLWSCDRNFHSYREQRKFEIEQEMNKAKIPWMY